MDAFNGSEASKFSPDDIDKFSREELIQIAEENRIPIDKRVKTDSLRSVISGWLSGVPPAVTETVGEAGAVQPVENSRLVDSTPAARSLNLPPGTRGATAGPEGLPDQQFTLPRYEPLSIPSTGSEKLTARHKIRLERLKMEAAEKEKERKAQIELQIEIRRLEIEAETAVKIRQLELDAQGRLNPQPSPVAVPETLSSPVQTCAFDVSKNVSLFPNFRETEVDSYFPAFERIALALKCPRDVWSILLQCKIQGKAQEIVASLSLAESLSYDKVKAAILRAYELVPEAYRQKFRNFKKAPSRTYVEFAREKGTLFDKWCTAAKCENYADLRELILLEDFKKNLPDRVVVYLNEQKVTTLAEASVLADEFVLTHRSSFSSNSADRVPPPSVNEIGSIPFSSNRNAREPRECFYCHKSGHVIANCLALKRKSDQSVPQTKGVGLIKTGSVVPNTVVDPCFEPFIFEGLVSLSVDSPDQRPVRILRDTGGSQSVILASVLPFSSKSSCGYGSVLRGIEMGYSPKPVHFVHVSSKLVTGTFPLAVCTELPISGVDMLMGNDLAGGKVTPNLEVVESLQCSDLGECDSVYPSCVITRARAQQNAVDLSDTFLCSKFSDAPEPKREIQGKPKVAIENQAASPNLEGLSLPCTRDRLRTEQRADPTLRFPFSSVVSDKQRDSLNVCYFLDDDLLMRKWSPYASSDLNLNAVYQIVVPKCYRDSILAVAHESRWSGHLGVTKTYQHILKQFFWPAMKKDVVEYCRTCHTCQIVGKPNQPVPQAPLHPIPALDQPFDRVIVDCVGPLPRTKQGNEYLLTIMCAATRYPEAIPLRKINSRSVIKALTHFFSTFGLPRVVQTDQGTNFQSKVFNEVMKSLDVKHVVSSPFHPESQGALERWHQTLKSMLRKYCLETGKNWDEGIPFVLFAARDSVQESLGFSPADLVFAHSPRGPLKALKEKFLNSTNSPTNVLDYVSDFRERLLTANKIAKMSLSVVQSNMKRRFDKKAVKRELSVGDNVLVLLPIAGSALSAKFSGPYVVKEKISDTNYVIHTPDRRRKTRVCHINMLKLYHARPASHLHAVSPSASALIVADAEPVPEDVPCQSPGVRLQNSQMLQEMPLHLTHLNEQQRDDLTKLFCEFPSLFNDSPTQTSVLTHDIDVKDAKPIRQHPYRVNPAKRALMKQEAEYLLKHGLAKHSSSAWSSPCLVESKPDGSPRFITDYRKVNAVTVPDAYPMPRMEECVDNLGPAKYVSKLDLLKGFWQVRLTERASEISAFVTPDYFLQYTVMAFGMCNAPATFQRLVNNVLQGVPCCNAYLDDLIVHSRTWEEHLATLTKVFARLAQASLTLNLAKCEFGKATVIYLGREVGQGQVRPVEAKVSAIASCVPPPTRRALRRFLGMAGYYRSFCRNFSSVALPLTNLLSPKLEYVWTPECQHAFESVKSLLCHAPVLSAPDCSRPFKLEVDASGVGAGAVLLQDDDAGVSHPVSYFSRKFNKHQLAYSTIEKETLSLLLALQHFEVYLGSSSLPVMVFTDHNPLVFLSRMYNHNQRLMRWALMVQDFNLEIRHKKGSDNVFADALSRF